jgi:hypothetical protein
MAIDREIMARGGSESYEDTFTASDGGTRQLVFHKAAYRTPRAGWPDWWAFSWTSRR